MCPAAWFLLASRDFWERQMNVLLCTQVRAHSGRHRAEILPGQQAPPTGFRLARWLFPQTHSCWTLVTETVLPSLAWQYSNRTKRTKSWALSKELGPLGGPQPSGQTFSVNHSVPAHSSS